MKKIIVLTIFAAYISSLSAQKDSTNIFQFELNNWSVNIIDYENIYPTYLADPLGARFDVSVQKMKYSDIDFFDSVNEDGGYLGKLVVNPGVRFSFLKFRSKKNSKLGFELDVGITTPIVMRGGNHDVIAVDGIYYLAFAARPFEWLSMRFSKHHICTHIGDEFPSGKVISPIDIDPNMTQLPVRDDFIFSTAVRPLYFLRNPKWDILNVYGDFGFFMPGVDFMGKRQNKPNMFAYINLQAGAELEYYFKNKYLGGVFTAYNVSAYQLNAFYPNQSLVGGYILPQKRNEHKLRIGLNYYNGRSLSNQFYNRKEKFVAFFVAADI
ncbi:MAG: hypothetical protein KAI79_12560 [Bacteroidales bacterium]|nr:hypothetical protein [Bacteroidales bacterium]